MQTEPFDKDTTNDPNTLQDIRYFINKKTMTTHD